MSCLGIFGSQVVDYPFIADGGKFLFRASLADLVRIQVKNRIIRQAPPYHSQHLIGLLQGCGMSRARDLSLKDLAPRVGPTSCCHRLKENFLASEPSSAGV